MTELEIRSSSRAPFVRTGYSALNRYIDILISFVPLIVWGTVCFGIMTLVNVLCAAFAAFGTGVVYSFVRKRRLTVTDLHGAVTGALLALCLPTKTSLIVIAGFAVAAELAHRFLVDFLPVYLNPVCLSLTIVSLLSLGGSYIKPSIIEDESSGLCKYALDVLYSGELPEDSFFDLVLGRCAGPCGTVSVVLVILAGAYLAYRHVINLRVPAIYIAAAAVTAAVMPVGLDRVNSLFYELFSGAIFFGAVYLATDSFTIPRTYNGKTWFACIAGALSVLCRVILPETDAVFPAIAVAGVLMQAAEPYLFVKKPKKKKADK